MAPRKRDQDGYDYDYDVVHDPISNDEHGNADKYFRSSCRNDGGHVNVNGRYWRLQAFRKRRLFRLQHDQHLFGHRAFTADLTRCFSTGIL